MKRIKRKIWELKEKTEERRQMQDEKMRVSYQSTKKSKRKKYEEEKERRKWQYVKR